MAIRTRQPTGVPTWPLVLIEGPELSGKTYTAAAFTASQQIGECYWVAWGEAAPDEYAAIPGAQFQVVDHDGSWHDILGQVTEIHTAAATDWWGKPPVLIVDSMTSVWEMLKNWITVRARESKHAQKLLREDPNAEIKLSNVLWDDASDRHADLMRLLTTFNGIVVVTARCKESFAVDSEGRPIPNTADYRVDAHRTLTHDASVWVRLTREEPATLIGCRSVSLGISPAEKPLRFSNFTLDHLLFERLDYAAGGAKPRDVTALVADEAELAARARAAVRDYTRNSNLDEDVVLGEFYRSRGEALKDCRDVGAILAFLNHLKGRPA
ncbi:AAA family ATPase [Mycolicibacterium palauense]|uniref:AAA family ATPase n=1 Tax=Mycolicibacterium palauense TaxID=2034511 RepID=UPI000BFED940|nr:AAA family ATPase [Mycolicibacterium palauense]